MRALIAMSGGVDSSVAAKIMIDEGYECVGCTMKLHDNGPLELEDTNTCCTLSDVEDARNVARRLGMDYYVFNFQDDFKEKIIDKFVKCYQEGRTPNPCIDCNRYMKFDKLFERAKVLECDYIVTGHYVRIEFYDGKYHLLKAVDETKDQSYVLYSMNQYQLEHAKFPLGGLQKTETRKIAEANDFINANKPDSQDICFVPDGDYATVIEKFSEKTEKPGNFVDTEGNILGKHKGITHYTIGQRKGLGIPMKYPVYVQKIDVERNEVVLGTNEELFSCNLTASEVNWISGEVPAEPIRCAAKIRYRHKEQPCVVTPIGNDCISVVFDEPQRAITPGQAVVLYNGDEVLGGGVILGTFLLSQ